MYFGEVFFGEMYFLEGVFRRDASDPKITSSLLVTMADTATVLQNYVPH